MSNPYGGPGNPAPASVHRGLTGVITILSAWLGAALVGLGSISGFQHFRVADPIRKPKITDDKYEAWKLASDLHSVLQTLLIISALMAAVLVVGNLLSMVGKPAGRPMEIIGGAWIFVGGLFSVTFGGDRGLAAESFVPCVLIVVGAALVLVSVVLTVTTPVRPVTAQHSQFPPAPMPYQPPRV
ncbi:hypothetical protein DFR70_106122 [Nocardia tenerifensis]|uniref:Uncharacterized protein n=1 Tax=Nocardia tenerifensis TaxID=228006 RepID=A0A318JZX2_9NOCA|nr:hypothetical protein [Nocardia tenerifensis]PXX63068.1 hypothetical protein DFR70_106122 [Nocardia tenerifensis]